MDNEISRVSVRRFCERWRKKFGKSVRHWFVNELGGNFSERVHLHGLVWTGEDPEEIGKVWNFSPSNGRYKGRKLGGNLYIGKYVSMRTINYIVKYLHKNDLRHREFTSKVFASAGIGNEFLKTHNAKRNYFNGRDTNEDYIHKDGTKSGLPIYYRNKVFCEEDRDWETPY